MAIFDWNKNGKDDAFDTFMDYQLYKETFGKEDEDSDLDFEAVKRQAESVSGKKLRNSRLSGEGLKDDGVKGEK